MRDQYQQPYFPDEIDQEELEREAAINEMAQKHHLDAYSLNNVLDSFKYSSLGSTKARGPHGVMTRTARRMSATEIGILRIMAAGDEAGDRLILDVFEFAQRFEDHAVDTEKMSLQKLLRADQQVKIIAARNMINQVLVNLPRP